MTTFVPSPAFTDKGFVAPLESVILAGVQADQQAAFGGDLDAGPSTPQGQLAQSETAIIGDRNDQLLALFNGVDPAFASGRMQDGIARIYFLERIAAASTVVDATCVGLSGTVIPAGAQAIDQGGNVYLCTGGVVIPVGGSVTASFACVTMGPIACPANFLSRIYQAIPGWDSVSNPSEGVLGRDVESRADFEYRRSQSVAANATGSPQAVQGAVLSVAGVLDALTLDNPLGVPNGAEFTASVAGTTMTVTAVSYGVITASHMLTGSGVAAGTIISALGTGTGGTGTYTLNISQTLSSRTLDSTQFGVVMKPHSLYVAVVGGNATDIAQAIWRKKSAGCDYNGNTTVTVSDTGSGYVPPYPTYDVTFRIPDPTPILFAVTLRTSAGVPSNASTLVQQAIIAAFTGADGGSRARIGGALFASRFYAAVATLGAWAQIYSIKLGISAATLDSIQLRGDQVPTIAASNITVAFTT